MKLIKTRNDLHPKTRVAIVTLLSHHLANALDLGLQAKQAHWNVKGPHFMGLHELFDKIAAELNEVSDELAERAVALGGVAMGTVQVIAKRSKLPPYPLSIVTGKNHVAALAAALALFGASARKAIDVAAKAGDADTADLLTGVSRRVDTLLWMVEAHAQAVE